MDHAELLNESKQAATTLKSQLVSRRSWWMKNGKVRAGAYCDGAEPPKEEGEKKHTTRIELINSIIWLIRFIRFYGPLCVRLT